MKIFQNKIGSFSITLFLQNEALNPILACQTAVFPAITFRPFIHPTKRGQVRPQVSKKVAHFFWPGKCWGEKLPTFLDGEPTFHEDGYYADTDLAAFHHLDISLDLASFLRQGSILFDSIN